MDFRNRGISSEDFEVADHFKDRKLTFSEPDRHLGRTRTETFVDVFAQFNEKFFSSFSLLKVKTSATGIRFAPEPRPVTYRPKDLPRDLKNPLHHIETPRDLTLRYWWLPNLEKAEEGRLVGLAQSGDRRAFAQLFKHFHKFILGVAGKHMRGRRAGNWTKQTDGLFEDLVAAGCVGFCEALRNFDLSWDDRFSTLAYYRIAGAISDEAVAFRKRGIKSETDAHRAIFRRSKRPVFKSFEEFAAARDEVDAWGRRESYADDAKSGNSNDLRRGDAEYKADQEFKPEKYGGTESPAANLYDFFGQNQFSGHLRFHGRNDRYNAGRRDEKIFPYKESPLTVSSLIESQALEFERWEARRLKQIGRRAYALELKAHDDARAAATRKRDRVEWIISCAKRGVNIAENIKNNFEAPAGLQKEVA